MNKKQILWGILFALGLVLAASYSIDARGFHSGIYGIFGCICMLGAYVGMNWTKLQAKDRHTQRILYVLSGILVLIIILDIAEMLLS